MSIKILVATTNQGKVKEIKEYLSTIEDSGEAIFSIISLKDVGNIVPPVEDGNTFLDNALLKARYYQLKTGYSTIADDSGLEIDILDKKPGIYSARFAGEHATDEENNQKMLEELKKQAVTSSTARYISTIVFLGIDGKVLRAEGRVEGTIRTQRKGSGGFGYDPYFYLPSGKTMAELTTKEKNEISHRGKALRELTRKIAIYLES